MDIALISPVLPFNPTDGHRLAVYSDVNAILDNRLSLGVVAFAYGKEENTLSSECAVKIVQARDGGFASRFVRGVQKGLPPSCERLYSNAASKQITETLREWRPRIVIIDDASVGGYIPIIRSLLPQAKIVLRSHNVMHDVRLEQLKRTTGPARPAVQFDCKRYLAFERDAVASCDAHWAISPADARRMTELYNSPTAHLTVSIPLERYRSLGTNQGRENGFVHVGTLDFRRRSDLASFLEQSWPRILRANADATLILAGALRGNTIHAHNVTYCGCVSSDANIYVQGRFALNFQSSTGGIKLKTLTSLAAGRTLISTEQGVEGFPLLSGQHYWDMEQFLANSQMKEMLNDVRRTQPVADAGREYVMENHSRTAVARQFAALLSAL